MDGVAQLPVPTFVLALTNRRVCHRGLEPQASRQDKVPGRSCSATHTCASPCFGQELIDEAVLRPGRLEVLALTLTLGW
eukprot:scaffold32194_cov42-Phaeocystis_antarctica.AAC.1